MSWLLPNFSGPNQEEQPQGSPSSNTATEGALTRSRAQQIGAQLQLPSTSPGRGIGRGRINRSPSPIPNPGAGFFPSSMSTDIAELRRIAETAIQALAAATANQPPPRPKKPELPQFDKHNVESFVPVLKRCPLGDILIPNPNSCHNIMHFMCVFDTFT